MRVSIEGPAMTWVRQPATLRLLAAAFLLDAMTTFFVFAYGSAYLLRELHTNSSYPAIALAIYGGVKLTIAPPGGWLLGRHGRGICVALAFAAGAVGLSVALRANSAVAFLVAVGLWALAVSVFWLVVMASVGSRAAEDQRGVAGSLLGLVSAAATGAGVALSPVFELAATPRAAMTMVLLGLCGVAILLAGRGPEARSKPGAPRTLARAALPFLVLVLFHFAVLTAVAAAYLPFLLRVLDLSTFRAGLVVLPGAAAGGLAMVWSGSRSQPGQRFQMATWLYGLAAVALLVSAGETRPVLAAIAGVPLIGALAATAPLVNAAVLDETRSMSGASVLGWIFLAEGLGAVIGPAVMAAVIAGADVRWAMAVAAAGLAAMACGVFELRKVKHV